MPDITERLDTRRHALIVGVTGIAGTALAENLLAAGWTVSGLSRRPAADDRIRAVSADLRERNQLTEALTDTPATHVFYCSWIRHDTEQENCDVNSAMLTNVLDALAPHRSLRHVALMTGLKHYLGPFESYGQGDVPDTPFHEDEERLPGLNFYYAQEDALWAAAERNGFTWSVHRAHTVIGYTVGNAMNMGLTLAVQATLCREAGVPFVFPGSEQQWNGLTDMTDAGLLARHMVWASTDPAAADTAFNVVNGDVFRWRWLWPRIAGHFGVEAVGYADAPRPLTGQMAGLAPRWPDIAARHGLVESDIDRLASWWHTDGDLGRTMETLADMARSRRAGFSDAVPTLDAFLTLFDRYRSARLIP